jgi:hypothetical protein
MEFPTPPTLTGNPGQPRDLQFTQLVSNANGITLPPATELSSRPKWRDLLFTFYA